MPTSDEELLAKQRNVEKLRAQVAEANAQRSQREAAANNDLVAAQLDAEAARLQAELATAKQLAKAGAVKDGNAAQLEAAKSDMRRAVEQQKAAEASASSKKNEEG